jgi:hypothetical protein
VSTTRHGLLLVAAVLLTTSCRGEDRHAAELAAAACGSGLHDQLRLHVTDTSLSTDRVQVHGVRDGRRLTGTYTSGSASGHFVCDVVPDATDRLRGLRVIDLVLTPDG